MTHPRLARVLEDGIGGAIPDDLDPDIAGRTGICIRTDVADLLEAALDRCQWQWPSGHLGCGEPEASFRHVGTDDHQLRHPYVPLVAP